MQTDIKKILASLDAKKAILDSYRPLPPELIKNLQEWLRIELTYSSNALEGNTLTSSETALVVEKGITIGGKSVQEHLEAINHAHAFDFIMAIAQNKHEPITWHDILSIHQLILHAIDDQHAGKVRNLRVKVAGSSKEFAEPHMLQDHIDTFMQWLHTSKEEPFIMAADAHLKLVTIHPFIDGNGRTARLLMNLLLIRAGYTPALILPEDLSAYIAALQQADTGNKDAYYTVIAQAVERTLTMYIDALKK